MRRVVCWLLPLLGCACSTGGPPPGPVAWPAGEYYLEASVSYVAGIGQQRNTYSADLHVAPDGSLRLDSHTGVCRDPTDPELQRDRARRIRTFRCGEETFVVRPGDGTVTGEVRVEVEEAYRVTECIRREVRNGVPVCAQSTTSIRTRTARKEARLRVREVR